MGCTNSKAPVVATESAGASGDSDTPGDPMANKGSRERDMSQSDTKAGLDHIKPPDFHAPYLGSSGAIPSPAHTPHTWRPDPRGGATVRQLARVAAKAVPPFDEGHDLFGVPLLAGAFPTPRDSVFTHLLHDSGSRGRRAQDCLFKGRGDKEALLRSQLALTEVLQFAGSYKRGEAIDRDNLPPRAAMSVDMETGSISAASFSSAGTPASKMYDTVLIELLRKHALLRALLEDYLRGAAFDEGNSRLLRRAMSPSMLVSPDGGPSAEAENLALSVSSIDGGALVDSDERAAAWLPVYILVATCDICVLQELCFVSLAARPARLGWLKWRARLVDSARTFAAHISQQVQTLRGIVERFKDGTLHKQNGTSTPYAATPSTTGGGHGDTPVAPGATPATAGGEETPAPRRPQQVGWSKLLQMDPEFAVELISDAMSVAAHMMTVREASDTGEFVARPNSVEFPEPVPTTARVPDMGTLTSASSAPETIPFTITNGTLVSVELVADLEAWTNAELGQMRKPGSLKDMTKCVDALDKWYPQPPTNHDKPCRAMHECVGVRLTGSSVKKVPGGMLHTGDAVVLAANETLSGVVTLGYPTSDSVLRTLPAGGETLVGGNIVFCRRSNTDNAAHVCFRATLAPPPLPGSADANGASAGAGAANGAASGSPAGADKAEAAARGDSHGDSDVEDTRPAPAKAHAGTSYMGASTGVIGGGS